MSIRHHLILALGLVIPTVGIADTLLSTDPSETYLSIEGPVSLAGLAPLSLEALPSGRYTVTATGDGLARGRSRFFRSDRGLVSGDRPGIDSLLYPPGWHHAREDRWRGLAFAGAGITSGILAARAHANMRTGENERDRATLRYRGAVLEDDILDARREVMQATTAWQDHQEVRRLWGVYLGAVWGGAALETWLLTPRARMEHRGHGEYVLTVPRAARAKLAGMSLLVPGAGQRYVGRSHRGTLLSVAVALLSAQAIESHDDFLTARREQSAAQFRYDRARTTASVSEALHLLERAAEKADDRDVTRRVFFGAAVAIYLVNAVDAYFLGHVDGPDSSSEPPLSVVIHGNAIGAQVDWSFQ